MGPAITLQLLYWVSCAPGLSFWRSHLGSSLDGGEDSLGQGEEGSSCQCSCGQLKTGPSFSAGGIKAHHTLLCGAWDEWQTEQAIELGPWHQGYILKKAL